MSESSARPTLQNVADTAQVSLKTASRVLNGEPHVREELRSRVFDAAMALGYKLNASASMLGRGTSSDILAFITNDIENPFSSSVAKGVEAAAREFGMRVMISSSDDSAERELALVEEFALRHVRGIILMSTLRTHEQLGFVLERKIPLTFVDRAAHGIDAPSVIVDNHAAAREATEHLISLGHRRIAFVGEYLWPQSHVQRFAGFSEAMRAAGLDVDARYLRSDVHGVSRASEVVTEVLGLPEPPTALFASNNLMTVGAVAAVGRLTHPPAICGFDDFPLAEMLGITVIQQDPVRMGMTAVRALVDVLNGKTAARTVFSAPLVVRESSRPVSVL